MVVVVGLAIGPLLYAQVAPGSALPAGDAPRGKAIVEGAKGNCLSCHRIGGVGSLYGPDLSTAGLPPRSGGGGGRGRGGRGGPGGVLAPAPAGPARQQELAQSILDPDAVVAVQNRYVRLTMKDGTTVWGKLLNLDTFAVQIFDSTETLANVSRADVSDMTMASPMPSYRSTLTTQDVADVVEYLLTLKGQ